MEPILRILRQTLVVTACLLGMLSSKANNIQVTNASLTGNDLTQGFCFVQFDLAWENSWRLNGVVNWDAAWVFVKFRTPNGIWQHAYLGNTGHIAPGGSQIDLGLLTPGSAFNATTNPVVGTFIRRSADGTGPFSTSGVQLRWNYMQQGIGFNDITEVRVFGIEMVYVNQGAFAVGSGGTENNAFTLTTINTANATTAATGTGSLGGQAGGFPTGQTAPASVSWPNGFNAFYCMKYEMTQQGYVDFLNTLTYTQQEMRTATAPNSSVGTGGLTSSTNIQRNGIDLQTPGVPSNIPAVYACNLDGDANFGEATDGLDIAVSFISWGDLCAYLDWSGLRPLSELEYEKACRGPLLPVPGEFPWGTVNVASVPYTLGNAGSMSEDIAANYSTAAGNAAIQTTINFGGAINGPVRVGIFAANPLNSGRVTSGATYYGLMNMGDNLLERTVALDQIDGKSYTGLHGNGSLTTSGDPNVSFWPSPTTALGSYQRGGYWQGGPEPSRVSHRFTGAVPDRGTINGGRGVRLAP